jgi:hypothetical protein
VKAARERRFGARQAGSLQSLPKGDDPGRLSLLCGWSGRGVANLPVHVG